LFFTNDGSKGKTFDNGIIGRREQQTPATETPKTTTNPSTTKTSKMTMTKTMTKITAKQ